MDGDTRRVGAVAAVPDLGPPDHARARGARRRRARAARRAGRLAVRRRARDQPRTAWGADHRARPPASPGRPCSQRTRARGRHRRRGCARSPRPARRGHLDRRDRPQALGPGRRLADPRRRHLGRSRGRGLGDRRRRGDPARRAGPHHRGLHRGRHDASRGCRSRRSASSAASPAAPPGSSPSTAPSTCSSSCRPRCRSRGSTTPARATRWGSRCEGRSTVAMISAPSATAR